MSIISKEKLINSLLCVRPGLANKELIEQSTSFVFKLNRVWTYNDMIAVSCPVDLQGIEGVVLAEQFYDLVTKINDREIDIVMEGEVLCVRGSKFFSKFTTKQGEVSLPLLNVDINSSLWTYLPKEFVHALKFCLFSVSNDLTRLALTCLHLEKAEIESCDNYRLTKFFLSGDNFVFPCGIALPLVSAKELIKYSPVAFLVEEGWIHFKLENSAVFSCRVYEVEYPSTDFILEMESGEPIVFPSNMVEILSRAGALAEVDLTGERVVSIEIQNGEIKVTSQGPVGQYEEKSRIRVSGHYKFECNLQFLQEILNHLRTAEVAKGGSKLKFTGDSFVHVMALQGVE